MHGPSTYFCRAYEQPTTITTDVYNISMWRFVTIRKASWHGIWRGYCLQAKKRSDLTLRDFRRMVILEMDDAELRHNRILQLEMVQGALRQSAYRVEQEALLQVANGWQLHVLQEGLVLCQSSADG